MKFVREISREFEREAAVFHDSNKNHSWENIPPIVLSLTTKVA